MDGKRQKNSDALKIGVFLMFLSLAVLVVYFFFTRPDIFHKSTGEPEITAIGKDDLITTPTPVLAWVEYKNDEFGFQMMYPKFLYRREFRDQGGFKVFLLFEETKFSSEKGLGLGVSERTFKEEVENTKTSFSKQDAKLVKEEKINVGDQEGIRLDFEPEGEGEKRSAVIFSKEKYSYSISTVPEQIEKVIQSFKFL